MYPQAEEIIAKLVRRRRSPAVSLRVGGSDVAVLRIVKGRLRRHSVGDVLFAARLGKGLDLYGV